MVEYAGVGYLRNQLRRKQPRVELRYRYYEQKNGMVDLGIATPEKFKALNERLGWCTKAVDAVADRLSFRGFRNDVLDMETIYRMNNPDVLFDAAILSALISACCFLYISPDEDGYPRIQVIDGSRATGIPDPVTGMLREGYAVLERDRDTREPIVEAYFVAGRTDYYERRKKPRSVDNPASYPLLVPVVYRPDEVRPFGHSRISRACMGLMQAALRTLKRAEISAEFYSFPQKYVLGTSQDAEPLDRARATISSMLEFTKDDDGDKPSVGQFQQQSMTPYVDQMRMFASSFAAEADLTLSDLGYVQDNPTSAEALRDSHEALRLKAEKAQESFGRGFLNAGYLAACLRDGFAYERRVVEMTTPIWNPVFTPDMSALSVVGDAVIKINQAVPGYFDAESLRDLTGIEGGGGV